MSRAADLFKRLREGGLEELEQMIADREPESLFLDFKRAAGDGVGVNLANDDNKNISKAISGFGNSEGGVIVWGIDFRRDRDTGIENADRRPLTDAAGFRTKLEAAISRATIPVHSEVECISIMERGAAGYVAMHVPRAANAPLRSNFSNHYHLRAGSDFGVVPHEVLAGMFGRGPRPAVSPNFVMRFVRLDETRESLVISLAIGAANTGSVLAERPYFSMWLGDFPVRQAHVAAPLATDYSVRRGTLPGVAIVSNPGVVLVPGTVEMICDLVLHVPTRGVREFEFQCGLGAQGQPPIYFQLKANHEALTGAIERLTRNEVVPIEEVIEVAIAT